ncbi:hypothetical protein HIM_05748 [Hirsutella minnesotensis 3608]|uniref:Glucose-methanol-choline oxidoreductase N-terminal domain-containing protein n=1 Tax=Hirsutella minnesotensis 3608 TaxID=1043627 RepID=A0A0F8A575_9HYPO|nr:hypothetical protein HIM_05748 [Hirsutella minnesotensis 3608]
MGLYTELPPDLREVDVIISGAGPSCYNDANVVHPGLLVDHLSPGARLNKTCTGKTSEKLGGRERISSLMYARGRASDYDGWEAPGWTGRESLPCFK